MIFLSPDTFPWMLFSLNSTKISCDSPHQTCSQLADNHLYNLLNSSGLSFSSPGKFVSTLAIET